MLALTGGCSVQSLTELGGDLHEPRQDRSAPERQGHNHGLESLLEEGRHSRRKWKKGQQDGGGQGVQMRDLIRRWQKFWAVGVPEAKGQRGLRWFFCVRQSRKSGQEWLWFMCCSVACVVLTLFFRGHSLLRLHTFARHSGISISKRYTWNHPALFSAGLTPLPLKTETYRPAVYL